MKKDDLKDFRLIFGQMACRTSPGGVMTDWRLRQADKLLVDQVAELKKPDPHPDAAKSRPIKPGDLMFVFKTITEGKVHWQGTMDLAWDDLMSGKPPHMVAGLPVTSTPKGMEPEAWVAMFRDRLPAKVEHGPRVYYGSLVAEEYNGAVQWSIAEFGKKGFNRVALSSGDYLTVYREVTDGAIDWQGLADFVPAKNKGGDTPLMDTVPLRADEKQWRRMVADHSPMAIAYEEKPKGRKP